MDIKIPEMDETTVRALGLLCATFICGPGSNDHQRVMGIAAVLSEFVDDGSVILKTQKSRKSK